MISSTSNHKNAANIYGASHCVFFDSLNARHIEQYVILPDQIITFSLSQLYFLHEQYEAINAQINKITGYNE